MANLRHAALLKRDSSTGDFSKILRELLFSYVIQKCVLKNSVTLTAKFMWMTASGISENGPCLAGCKFIDVLQNGL